MKSGPGATLTLVMSWGVKWIRSMDAPSEGEAGRAPAALPSVRRASTGGEQATTRHRDGVCRTVRSSVPAAPAAAVDGIPDISIDAVMTHG